MAFSIAISMQVPPVDDTTPDPAHDAPRRQRVYGTYKKVRVPVLDGNESSDTEDEVEGEAATTLVDIGLRYMIVCAPHLASHAAKDSMWRFFMAECHNMSAVLNDERAKVSYKTMRRRCAERLPPLICTIGLQHKVTDEVEEHEGMTMPVFKHNEKRILYDGTRVKVSSQVICPTGMQSVHRLYTNCTPFVCNPQMADLVKFHEDIHGIPVLGTELRQIKLSSDGIQECNSTAVSIDAISVKFSNCKSVYLVSAVRTRPGRQSNAMAMLELIVQEIKYEQSAIGMLFAN
jgi:hypothetical protein